MMFQMVSYGTTFSTRPRGAELRRIVEETWSDDTLTLDFTGVLSVSHSFADEFYGELRQRRHDEVEFCGASDEVARVLNRALANRLTPAVPVDVETLLG